MKTIFQFCLGSLLVLLVGCAHDVERVRSPFLGQQVLTNSSDERSCALHGATLVTTNGFALSRRFSGAIPEPEYLYIGSWYPNHVRVGASLSRTQYCDEPTQVTYCPECDAEYERACKLYRFQNRGRDE